MGPVLYIGLSRPGKSDEKIANGRIPARPTRANSLNPMETQAQARLALPGYRALTPFTIHPSLPIVDEDNIHASM
jgi:hypothetical protein